MTAVKQLSSITSVSQIKMYNVTMEIEIMRQKETSCVFFRPVDVDAPLPSFFGGTETFL